MCDVTFDEQQIYDETVGVCQICKRDFDPENYGIDGSEATLSESCQSYHTFCPECALKTDIWESDDSIILKNN
jgi:hypothetical protein